MKLEVLEVSASPHIRVGDSTSRIMWRVVAALLPALAVSVWLFGMQAMRVVFVSVFVSVLTEFIIRNARKKDMTIGDGSAVITGVLLAFVVPPTTPLWMVAIGAFCAIALCKEVFGGLGMNIFNPALASRAILLAAFPVQMTAWITPDGISCATPLAIIKEGGAAVVPETIDLFVGTIGGSLGETSAIALLIGGLYLIVSKVIKWEMPVVYLGGIALLSLFLGRDPLVAILAGGAMLGGFFMITDMVTTPITRMGGVVFAAGCAIVTVVIRQWGGYPEGVCYSILIMNALTPLIDRVCMPRVFGKKKVIAPPVLKAAKSNCATEAGCAGCK